MLDGRIAALSLSLTNFQNSLTEKDLHMAQLMPLQLTVSCFSKIQIGFTFLVPAHLGSPGKRAVKWVCVCLTEGLSGKFSTNAYVNIPPHLKYVTKLLCEISMFKKLSCSRSD